MTVLRWPVASDAVLLALGAAAALCWAVWWTRRPARPRLAAAAAAVVTVVAVAAVVNAQFAYLPRVGDVASVAGVAAPWPTVSAADLHDAGAARTHPACGVYDLPVPGGGTGFGGGTFWIDSWSLFCRWLGSGRLLRSGVNAEAGTVTQP